MNSWTAEDVKYTNEVVLYIFKSLAHNKIPEEHAASALMICTAKTIAHCDQTDAEIVDQFRKCLQEARMDIKGATQ